MSEDRCLVKGAICSLKKLSELIAFYAQLISLVNWDFCIVSTVSDPGLPECFEARTRRVDTGLPCFGAFGSVAWQIDTKGIRGNTGVSIRALVGTKA